MVTGREETEEEEEAKREEKNESEKRPIPDPANRKTLQMANDHEASVAVKAIEQQRLLVGLQRADSPIGGRTGAEGKEQ